MSIDVLWAPWRMDYILGPKPDECVFCIPEHTREDAERLVLHRGKRCYVLMNKFPYNNGHLMVAPYRHVGCVTELSDPENHELADLTRRCVTVLREAMNPQGLNTGFNLGEAAGAGIAAHLHYQMVPRWNGDASFMAVFGEARVIPQHLDVTYALLKPLFTKLDLHNVS